MIFGTMVIEPLLIWMIAHSCDAFTIAGREGSSDKISDESPLYEASSEENARPLNPSNKMEEDVNTFVNRAKSTLDPLFWYWLGVVSATQPEKIDLMVDVISDRYIQPGPQPEPEWRAFVDNGLNRDRYIQPGPQPEPEWRAFVDNGLNRAAKLQLLGSIYPKKDSPESTWDEETMDYVQMKMKTPEEDYFDSSNDHYSMADALSEMMNDVWKKLKTIQVHDPVVTNLNAANRMIPTSRRNQVPPGQSTIPGAHRRLYWDPIVDGKIISMIGNMFGPNIKDEANRERIERQKRLQEMLLKKYTEMLNDPKQLAMLQQESEKAPKFINQIVRRAYNPFGNKVAKRSLRSQDFYAPTKIRRADSSLTGKSETFKDSARRSKIDLKSNSPSDKNSKTKTKGNTSQVPKLSVQVRENVKKRPKNVIDRPAMRSNDPSH